MESKVKKGRAKKAKKQRQQNNNLKSDIRKKPDLFRLFYFWAMKFLIVGLGNPGEKYHYNRHNIGFLVLNKMAQDREKEFEADKHGYTCTINHRGKKLVLLKPTTFMNLSGKAVRFHLQKEKIQPSNLLVIVDDLSLPFGKLRLRAKGSAGGHNGLSNINDVLGNQNYARLRFGIGDDFPKGRQVDYVLSDFNSGEMASLPELMDRSEKIILDFVQIGVNRAMSAHN